MTMKRLLMHSNMGDTTHIDLTKEQFSVCSWIATWDASLCMSEPHEHARFYAQISAGQAIAHSIGVPDKLIYLIAIHGFKSGLRNYNRLASCVYFE